MTIYHAHVFFGADEAAAANAMREALVFTLPSIEVGPFLPRAAGPLPCPMFQITLEQQFVEALTKFLEENRENRSVLLHPLTNNELADHTINARWFGEPLPLNLDQL